MLQLQLHFKWRSGKIYWNTDRPKETDGQTTSSDSLANIKSGKMLRRCLPNDMISQFWFGCHSALSSVRISTSPHFHISTFPHPHINFNSRTERNFCLSASQPQNRIPTPAVHVAIPFPAPYTRRNYCALVWEVFKDNTRCLLMYLNSRYISSTLRKYISPQIVLIKGWRVVSHLDINFECSITI